MKVSDEFTELFRNLVWQHQTANGARRLTLKFAAPRAFGQSDGAWRQSFGYHAEV
jgi:hypothetical protein